MDDKTELLAVRFPEDMVVWLKSVAEARGWTVSRAMRWAVQETIRREGASKVRSKITVFDRVA
jgi:hypothetical protein